MKPKFRAWHKELKKMFDVKSLVFTIGTATIASRDDIVPSRNVGFDELIIMQSTGLVDKNGIEIYEGDIVKFSDCDDDVYVTHVVWDKDYACFGVSFSCGFQYYLDYLEEFYTELKDIEVIGNIYENPELLG